MPLLNGTSNRTRETNIREMIVCSTCFRPFEVPPHRIGKAKYCSRECYFAGTYTVRGSQDIACAVCGTVRRRPLSRQGYRTFTCSLTCRGIVMRAPSPRSGDYSSVRKWLVRNGHIKKCESCGFDEEPRILVAHHKDRDRTNNVLSNFKILCPNCHAMEHLGENLKGWKHRSTKRKPRRQELIVDAPCEIALS